MPTAVFKALPHNIYCIDALYTAPDIACCYLLVDNGECGLIETGTAHSVSNILATLKALGIERNQLRYVIPTHIHLDHAGGAGAIMEELPEAQLLIHPKGARHIIDPSRLIASAQQVYGPDLFHTLHGDIVPADAPRVRTVENNETIFIGRRPLHVKHTRGHAEHHFCLFDEHSNGWFSGDMFGVSYPRQRYPHGAFVMPATTPTQFDPALYQDSVRALCALAPEFFYLTHFGALPYQEAQRDQLLRQLDHYATLGRNFAGDMQSLEASVVSTALSELAILIPEDDAKAEAAALGIDATLNAQGIAWWSQQAPIANTPPTGAA